MSVLRFLSLLLLSVLMSACTPSDNVPERAKRLFQGETEQNSCDLGVAQTAQCYYVVKITNPIYDANGMVGGIASVLACLQNKHSGNDKWEDCTNFEKNRKERLFKVKGSPTLEKGLVYDFDSNVQNPAINELICRAEGGKCKVRNTEPDPVHKS